MPESYEKSSDQFKERILKSVRSALDAVLGRSLKVVALNTLKKQFGLQVEDFVTRPEEFRRALKSLFGNEGTRYIEDKIMQWFYTSIGLEYKPTRTSLPRKVSKARKDYDKVSGALRKSPGYQSQVRGQLRSTQL